MAITLKDNGEASNLPFTGAGGTVTMGQTCAINDVIFVTLQLLNATANLPPTITDNVNTGNYTLVNGSAYLDGTNQILAALYAKVANANGAAPVITCPNISSINASAGGKFGCFSFTGFGGTPSIDAALVGRNTGTINPVSSIALTTTTNPEVAVVMESGTNTFANGTGSGTWGTILGAGGDGMTPWYNIITTPALITFSDTATTVTNWQVTSAAFRVAAAGGGGVGTGGPVGGMFGVGLLGVRQ